MYDAFTVIKHVLPRDYTHINIYGMSDAHIGAKESSLSTLRAWVRTVLDDPYGYVIIAGTVKWKRCRIVVLPSLMDYASYAIRKELTPQMYGSIPVITLCGTRKRVDYHEYDTMIT